MTYNNTISVASSTLRSCVYLLCVCRVFKKTSPNSKVWNLIVVVSDSRQHLLSPRFLIITLSVCLSVCPWPQLTVYLGRRDFVDHLTCVDPVGELKGHMDDLALGHYFLLTITVLEDSDPVSISVLPERTEMGVPRNLKVETVSTRSPVCSS